MAAREVLIVIVTYKSAELTVDCLRSVARERFDASLSLRCVVVDNASGDAPRVREAIEAEGWSAWAEVIVAERNGGFAYGNNVGIRHGFATRRAEFVHMLNPDTVLHPGAIAALVRFMDTKPKAGIVGGIFENADSSEWAFAFRFPSLLSELDHGMELGIMSRLLRRWQVPMEMGHEASQVDWVCGASMLVRSDVLDTIGEMDEGFFLYYEETEFCFRAKQAGFEIWYTPDSRVTHISGQSTKVTERNAAPRRLPTYWFESRRRYFAVTRGVGYSVMADLVALGAGFLGILKRVLTGRKGRGVPTFLRDLWANSYLVGRNRRSAGFRPVPVTKRSP